jgi:hypothetical protein
MQNLFPSTSNVRCPLLPSDNATLYRKFSHRHGVDVQQKPEFNIHDWLDLESPPYVAMAETDTNERGALVRISPNILYFMQISFTAMLDKRVVGGKGTDFAICS